MSSQSDPCKITIHRVLTPGQGDVVRIDAMDGPKLLARIEMSPLDFAAVMTGTAGVTAALTMDRRP